MKICIGIPAFKAFDTIEECISSINIQSMRSDINVIIANDEPEDNGKYNYLSEKFGNRKEEIEETEETEELEKPEEKAEPIKVEDDFKKRIKEIAEKGIKEVRKEKLEKAKESAIRSEKEKFSKEKESNDHEIGDE